MSGFEAGPAKITRFADFVAVRSTSAFSCVRNDSIGPACAISSAFAVATSCESSIRLTVVQRSFDARAWAIEPPKCPAPTIAITDMIRCYLLSSVDADYCVIHVETTRGILVGDVDISVKK